MKILLLGLIAVMLIPVFVLFSSVLLVAPILNVPGGGNQTGQVSQTNASGQNASAANPNVPASGAALSATTVAALAKSAGVPADQLAIAVAIAMAESGLNPSATNVNTNGSVDRGLWQINNAAHPDVTDSAAFNPTTAAEDMLQISDGGTNWSPWVTYQTGAYLRYLPTAEAAVNQLGG
jgi:hypothetical protein